MCQATDSDKANCLNQLQTLDRIKLFDLNGKVILITCASGGICHLLIHNASHAAT